MRDIEDEFRYLNYLDEEDDQEEIDDNLFDYVWTRNSLQPK